MNGIKGAAQSLEGIVTMIADINKKSRFKFGFSLADSRNNRQSQSSQGGLGVAYSTALPIFATDRETGFGEDGNPLLRRKYQQWHTDELRFLGQMSYEKEVLRNLIWEIKLATDQMNLYDNLFIDKNFFAKDGIAPSERRSLSQLRNYKAANYMVNSNFVFYNCSLRTLRFIDLVFQILITAKFIRGLI
jgi:hypothetical protein